MKAIQAQALERLIGIITLVNLSLHCAILRVRGDNMAKIERWKPGDKAEVIDETSPHFGEIITFVRPGYEGSFINTGRRIERELVFKLEDNTEVAFRRSQIKKL